MIKVVLDTNVLISGLLWEGLPNNLLAMVKQGKLELCTSTEIIEELEGVLKREKFKPRIEELGTNVNELVSSIMILASFYQVETYPNVINEDPDDNMFLACALNSGANYVISGDRHLLSLGRYKHIKILSPSDFLDEIDQGGDR